MKGKASITIQAPAGEVAERWRHFEGAPDAASRLGPIEIDGGEDSTGLRWRTGAGAAQEAQGTTRFADAPGGRGTEVHTTVEFQVPGGPVGAAVKKVAGEEPLQLVRDDLRRLKQLIETGEIARSDGAPSGSSAETQPKQRPAQPLAPTPA